MNSKLIVIAGGSGSGKTYFVNKVKSLLDSSKLQVIPLDNYYLNLDNMTLDERGKQNFDHPGSLDFTLLIDNLQRLKSGSKTLIPEYDFTIHTRKKEMLEAEPKEIIILEGILTLTFEQIRNLVDLKLFIDTPDDIKFIRRLQRDIAERGRTVESVIDQYLTTVRPMYLKYILPTKEYADIIIDGTTYNPEFTKELIKEWI